MPDPGGASPAFGRGCPKGVRAAKEFGQFGLESLDFLEDFPGPLNELR